MGRKKADGADSQMLVLVIGSALARGGLSEDERFKRLDQHCLFKVKCTHLGTLIFFKEGSSLSQASYFLLCG